MLDIILKNKIFKNFSYLTVGNSIAQAISLFTVIKITHVLVPDEYGLFSFLTVQGMLLLVLADLGIKNIVVRTIARDPSRAKDLVFNGIFLKSGSLFFLALLYILYNYFFGSLKLSQLLLIFAFSFFRCLYDLFESAFFGREEMLIPAMINLGYSVLWFSAISLLPSDYFQVTYIFVIYLLLNLFKTLSGAFFIKKKKILFGDRPNFLFSFKTLIKESWPYFVLVIIMLPLTKLSYNFLEINSTLVQVGYFNLGQKLTGPVSLVIGFALTSIFPNLSALWTKDKGKFYQYVIVGFKYFMLAILSLCFLFNLFAKDIISLLFPASYLAAVKISQLQIWYLFLSAIDSLIGTIFGAINKEKIILKYAIIKALFCTPILYISSKYGALGLAYGFVISVGIFQIYLWFLFLKTVKIKIKHSDMLWLFSLILFLLSYYFLSDLSLFYKLFLAIIILLGSGIYLFKMYKYQFVT